MGMYIFVTGWFLSRSALVCVIDKNRIYYAQYNQMPDIETEYVFCKDNRFVLVGNVYL